MRDAAAFGVDVDHFRGLVLLDAMAEGLRSTWLRRAEAFEAAAPRDGDFTGRATAAQLQARRRRCLQIAAACRARADVSPLPGDRTELREVTSDD